MEEIRSTINKDSIEVKLPATSSSNFEYADEKKEEYCEDKDPSILSILQSLSPQEPFSAKVMDSVSVKKNDLAVTPMMRMRHTSAQEALTIKPSIPYEDNKEKKTDVIRAETQRKWKQKKKIAEQRREEERHNLNGRKKKSKKERPRKKRSDASTIDSSTVVSRRSEDYDDASIVSVAPYITSLQKFMDECFGIQCGKLGDSESVNEEGSEYDYSVASQSYANSESELASQSEAGSSIMADRISEKKLKYRLKTGSSTRQAVPTLPSADESDESRSNRDDTCSPFPGQSQASKSRESTPNDAGSSLIGIDHENFVMAFISKLKSKGMNVTVHQKNRSKKSPLQATALLTCGEKQPNGRFSGPRFSWETKNRIFRGSVDLFDIKSIDQAMDTQLEDFPMAKPTRAIFLQARREQDCILFDAPDEDAAIRIVHGLRAVVARLAFNLIIGDPTIGCELLYIENDDNEIAKQKKDKRPKRTALMKAMNDVANHLVDKAVITE